MKNKFLTAGVVAVSLLANQRPRNSGICMAARKPVSGSVICSVL